MNFKVYKIFFILIVSLPLILFKTGCTSRVDFLSLIEDASVPDINIKIGIDYNLPNGTGSYDFGTVEVDTSKKTTFIIENIGLMPLKISSISITSLDGGGFTINDPSTGSIIEAKSSKSFTITFNPSSEGYKSGTVLVVSDDPDEEQYTFAVEGYGSPIPVPNISIEKDETDIPNGSLGHDFGTVLLGESSTDVSFTIENNGTADLVIDSITISISDYIINDLSMLYTIPPGGSTSFLVTFSPIDQGQRTATVTIENNDIDNDPYTFTVTGLGEPKVPDIYITKGLDEIPHGTLGHDFGTVMVGDVSDPLAVIIRNRGTEVLYISEISSSNPQFAVDTTATLFTLPPGDTQSTVFIVTFEPVEPDGVKSADIIISSDDPDTGEYRFTVAGYASPTPVPDINVRRGAMNIPAGTLGYDFGAVEIGDTSPPITFTIANSGEADLTVTGISSSSGDFDIASSPSLPCDIQADGSEAFSVTFAPSSMGLSSAAITIMNNDPDENVFTFYVEGEAALADMRIMKGATPITNGESDAHDFGTVLVGDSSAPRQFTIENNGDADLIINSIYFSSGDISDFSYDDSSMFYTVPPGGNTSFSITFSPITTGHRSVTISIENNDPVKNPYTFTVEGNGEPKVPDIHVRQGTTNFPSGSTYDFGTVLVGSTSPVQFTIMNYGTGDLTVNDISSSSGEFFISSAPSMPFIVTPGSSRYFTIEFSPSSAGDKWATITLMSDDPDGSENPYTLTVQGYGESPVSNINVRQGLTDLPNGSGIYFFGHVQEFDSRTETFTIENNGTASLIISGILLTDGYTDQFVIDYSIPPISPGSSDSFTITFSPTYQGDKWAEVTIVSNDPDDDLYTFRVEGMVGLPPVVDIEVWEGATYYPDGSTYNSFGTISVGASSAPAVFTIWNNGPDDLVIPSIVITEGNVADFELDLNSTDLNTPIPPAWSTTFSVTFAPLSSGNKWLEIDINYNDPNATPYTLRVEGTGED